MGSVALPLLILLVALALPAAGQPAESTTPVGIAPVTEKPVAQVIPVSEIATRATADITQARELVRNSAPGNTLDDIQDRLPPLIDEIQAYRGVAVNEDIAGATPKLLNEANQQWLKYENTLKGWARALGEQAGHLEKDRATLAAMIKDWRLTAADSAVTTAPAAVQEQITAVRGALKESDTQITEQLNISLTLQSQTSEQLIAIADNLDLVRTELVSRQNDLFRATVPPIWSPIRHDDGTLGISADLVSTRGRIVIGVTTIWREFRNALFIHLVGFLALAGLMWFLRRRVTDDADENTQAARAILGRPLAASGLVSMLLWSPLYNNAPVVMHSLTPILALPFAAWLTPTFVPPERRRMVYGVLILTLMLNTQSMIVAAGFLRQFALLAIPVVGLAGLVILQRRLSRETDVIWPTATRISLSLGWIVFGTILVADVVGFVALGEHLADAVIASYFLAFVLLAGYRVVNALVLLALKTPRLRQLNVIKNYTDTIRKDLAAFTRLIATAMWIWSLVNRLMLREDALRVLKGWLQAVWQIGSLTISLGSILLFLLVFWLTLLIAKIVRNLLEDDILPRADVPRGRAHAISMLFNYAIVGIGSVAAVAAAGINVEQFALIGGALGVGIGFGLQNVVSNFVSGLILVFERPVQVGDTIEVGTLIGTVRRIGIRSSTVRTFDEAEVIVPNSDLISSHVVNWTLSDQLRRMEVKVGVAYGSDPVEVQKILATVARAHTKVLEYPAPYSLFKGFGDSSLDFVVRFWTSDFGNWIFIASEVTVGIEKALGEAGITIPFPQRDLHIYSVDPPAPIPDGGRVALPPAPEVSSESHRPQVDGDE